MRGVFVWLALALVAIVTVVAAAVPKRRGGEEEQGTIKRRDTHSTGRGVCVSVRVCVCVVVVVISHGVQCSVFGSFGDVRFGSNRLAAKEQLRGIGGDQPDKRTTEGRREGGDASRVGRPVVGCWFRIVSYRIVSLCVLISLRAPPSFSFFSVACVSFRARRFPFGGRCASFHSIHRPHKDKQQRKKEMTTMEEREGKEPYKT